MAARDLRPPPPIRANRQRLPSELPSQSHCLQSSSPCVRLRRRPMRDRHIHRRSTETIVMRPRPARSSCVDDPPRRHSEEVATTDREI